MSEKILKNRLGQPIPEKCPLSEALVWVITGCLPLSLEDYKFTKSLSIDRITEENKVTNYFIGNAWGESVHIDEDHFESVQRELLLAITKDKIKLWATFENIILDIDDMLIANSEDPSIDEYHLKSKWDEYSNKLNTTTATRRQYVEVPSNLWYTENVNWINNTLQPPPLLRPDECQFSDIEVSTSDLFIHFADKDHKPRPPEKKRFLIPINQAVSLVLSGSYDTDHTQKYDEWNTVSSSLIRHLRNGILYAEGQSNNSVKVVKINQTEWTSDVNIVSCQTQYFEHIVVDELEIRQNFEISDLPPSLDKSNKKIKQGRPPIVAKEVWLEELVLLFLSGEAAPQDKRESLAMALQAILQKKYNKKMSIDTVRKEWIRPLFKKTKEDNGGK